MKKRVGLRQHLFNVNTDFHELQSNFQAVRMQFEDAKTIEEKLRLVAISKQIIKAAHAEIDVFKSGLAARMILVGTLMTASPKK